MSVELRKGEFSEEVIRNYFLELGYFVIRSAKFHYQDYDITDIDLFLYSKSTPFTRERVNVDIKNKKTPQAIERVFWTRGLRDTLGFDKCIVVTTETRPDVVSFGKDNDVIVLDGNFLKRITERETKREKKRLFEEEFMNELDKASVGDLYGNWKKEYESNKSLMLKPLNFDLCNLLLSKIKVAFESYLSTNKNQSILRYLYLTIAYFFVVIDYSLRMISFKTDAQRKDEIDTLVRYGQKGLERSKELQRLVKTIMQGIDINLVEKAQAVSVAINEHFSNIRSEILADFFSKLSNSSKSFELAQIFEGLGFAMHVKIPPDLSNELKSIIGLLCDFHSIDRKNIL
jgi:hypothetical protein